MARADTRTYVSLDRAAFHLGIDPYHFNSIRTTQRPIVASCDDDWYQYTWQTSGKLSREEFALMLKEAESRLISYLNYSPIPDWFQETVKVPSHYNSGWISFVNTQRFNKSIVTKYGFVVDVGVKASVLVASPGVVLSDVDGDGFKETATITFATVATEPEELHVYYPGQSGKETWEIRPVSNVNIDTATGIATITMPVYLLVKWNLLVVPSTPDNPHIYVDGDDETIYLETVDVYHVYTDNMSQGYITYEPGSACSDVPCTPTTQNVCLYVREPRLGIVSYQPATWDNTAGAYTAGAYTGVPQKITYYYYAGHQDTQQDYPTRQMDVALERYLVYYALSLADREFCGTCGNLSNIFNYQTEDLGVNTPEKQHTLAWSDVGNPFGTKRAPYTLWKYVQKLRIERPQLNL